jgi:type IV pilus assembly protein PilA
VPKNVKISRIKTYSSPQKAGDVPAPALYLAEKKRYIGDVPRESTLAAPLASTLHSTGAYPAREYKTFLVNDVIQGETMRKREKGFSLIELLIVVAIILIIAAIAIPNLLRARIAANEASGVGSIRTLNTAQATYYTNWGVQYSNGMANLGGPTGVPATCALAELIDPVLAGATGAATAKSGYWFTYAGATATPAVGGCTGFQTYTFVGVPANCGQTGQRGFFTDQSGVIRFTTDCSAPTLASPPIQ